MRSRNSTLSRFAFVALFTALLALPLSTIAAPYEYFPTASETDGRFLSMAGHGLQTLADPYILIGIIVPNGETQLELGIFDGDTSGMWDLGSVPLEYTLLADPDGDGTGTLVVGQWMGNTMPDNAWFTATVPTGPQAQAPSGHYFYVLQVRSTNLNEEHWSNFKIRARGFVTLKPQAFAFTGALFTEDEARVLYPNYPDIVTSTTYDGTWDFYFLVPPDATDVAVWDGDLDFGSYDHAQNDSDDPDTPNNVLPPWAIGTAATFEGVAAGTGGATGAPTDDSEFAIFRRSPSVFYTLTAPDGRKFLNPNPSGNLEWEQFRVETSPTVPADYHVLGSLPAGLYHVHMEGMDLSNLNAWRTPYEVVTTPPLRPYIIGDLVWRDGNGNAVQDAGESGVPNVLMELLDHGGNVMKTTVTDSNGSYTFEVDPGTYTVRVAAVNFTLGGPLEGMVSTTGGNTQIDTVVNSNILTYDFGYKRACGDVVCILVARFFTDQNKLLVVALSTQAPTAQLSLSVPGTSLNNAPMAYADPPGLYLFYAPVNPQEGWVGRNAIVQSSRHGSACRIIETDTLKCTTCGPLVADAARPEEYWKQHPDAWPVAKISIGDLPHTKAQAVALLNAGDSSDMTFRMFKELVAAKLNAAQGAGSSDIAEIIDSADAWMAINGPAGKGVAPGSPAWQHGSVLRDALAAFNSGNLKTPQQKGD